MLGADVVVVEALRFFLGEGQDLARALRELVEAIHPVERPFSCQRREPAAVAMLARPIPTAVQRTGGAETAEQARPGRLGPFM